MRIRTHEEINGITAKYLRGKAGMPQGKFWGLIGVQQSTGSQYETGTRPLPRTVKKLLFITYEAGVLHDTATLQGADKLRDFVAHAASL